MAKTKKKLMIPFTYFHEEMIDYTRHYYEEGKDNSGKIWWDTEENKEVCEPRCPHKPSDTYCESHYIWWGGKDRWEAEVAAYPEQRAEFEKRQEEFTENVHSGKYLLVNDIIWKENYEFEDSLRLTSMSRVRSTANFNLKSETDGRNYNLFMTDTVDIIQNCEISKGVIKGKWTFCKRGAKYGVKPVLL